MTHAYGKSDRAVLPTKPPNNPGAPGAEAAEGRARPKGNPPQRTAVRTQGRVAAPAALERVRQAAKRDRKQRFTALYHHVYDVARLRAAYLALKRDAAAGVDGETWQHYGEALDVKLQDLAERLKRGAYRAQPVRRAWIPKADGRQRPLGVPALEDKIVQRAVVEVLHAIYDTDFLGFSYGFRPGRSPHQAVDALSVGLLRRKVNWVLDADIRGFFDTLDHGWLLRFLEHRIGDRRILRLIQQWLRAGVLDDGERIVSDVGTVQGGSISPLLANVYLHYVLDQWIHQWRQRHARGDVIVVRYADDFVIGFQDRHEAAQGLHGLRERLAQFGLALHPDKTRLLEFGRYAVANRRARGDGKPETFNFLGFTHSCATTRRNGFTVLRQTMRQRWQAKLRAVKAELQHRRHQAIPEQGAYLRAVLVGHVRYYGVPMNSPALGAFRGALARLWYGSLGRRSQRGRILAARMKRYVTRWLPAPRVCHPYPLVRFGVVT
jgi:RNA-directed DNA polymerase